MSGWVYEPNGRGTFSILWSCAQTIALCAWVSTCVSVPAARSKNRDIFRDKVYFMLLTCLGPEIVAMLSFTQWQAARLSVEDFKAAGYDRWTITHAFYANMGGMHVEPRGWKRFPANAKQLFYLVKHGYMDFPSISLGEIEVRSKADVATRFITLAQTLYFTISTLARLAQGLAITTLELTVLSFVLCTVITIVCWWHKPNGVELAHNLPLNATMEEIIIQAGAAVHEPYRNNPLDFVSDDPWVVSALWSYNVNILRSIGTFPDCNPERPAQKITSFDWPRPASRTSEFALWMITLAYMATFFGAWNFQFPSEVERIMWQASAGYQAAAAVLAALHEIPLYNSWPKRFDSKTNSSASRPVDSDVEMANENCLPRQKTIWNRSCNNSPCKNSFYDVPLPRLVLLMPFCAVYTICRCYVLMEDLVNLRSVPASAYECVDWTQFLPFF